MNQKKWRKKFAGRDSRRWLKHHNPMYSAPKLPDNWEAKVYNALMDYPKLKRESDILHLERRRNAPDRRPVELALTWMLPHKDQAKLDAVETTCLEMRRLPHGSTATKLIRYRYWEGRYPVPSRKEAAASLGITYGQARQLECIFKGAVARRLGHRVTKGSDGFAR